MYIMLSTVFLNQDPWTPCGLWHDYRGSVGLVLKMYLNYI